MDGADHEKSAGFPLRGKHAKAECGACHKDLPSGRRTYLTAQPACQGCHSPISPHGPLRDNGCQRCHTDAGWSPQIRFDHQKETQYPLEGKHQEVPCTGCHKDRKFRMAIAQYADCSPCHQSKHGGTFGKEACRTCHVDTTWTESAFDHGKRTRFQLTANHVAPTLKDCRSCHRGKGPSDFEDLRGLVTGRGPARSFPVNCLGCHQHAKAHNGQFTSGQCLNCHERPGTVEPKACRGPTGYRDAKCINKMAWFGHGPGKPFPLTGGHDLARMKAKCQECHRNRDAGQGFGKVPADCVSCHGEKDPHRRSLGKQCEDCHDFSTGTWKNTVRFNHQRTAFPLEGKHQKTPCARCHPSAASLATRFKPRPMICGDAECHKKDDTKHKGQLGPNCGARAGCHDPRDGHFIDPRKREGANP